VKPPAPIRERLTARLAHCPDADCECLLWSGTINRKGYGTISIANVHRLVHRVMWQLEVGPIPDGLCIDHVRAHGCRHRNCANVAHLEPVTNRENLLRGDTITAACAAATHCPKGHPYDEANTYRKPRGDRNCRTCHRERMRQLRAVREPQAA